MIIVNFKIYEETFGDKAIELAGYCQKVAQETKVPIYIAASALNAWQIQKETEVPVLLQHLDPVSCGRGNGRISPLLAGSLGLKGSLINHSEDKQPPGAIKKILKLVPKDFMTVVCIRSIKQALVWSKKPISYLAYEPSELIASSDKSVASEKPDSIRNMVAAAKNIPVLVGAGIKSRRDVKTALQMGAKGILVASSVTTAKEPYHQLKDLAEGFAIIR